MSDIVFCCQHCQESLIVDATGVGVRVPCPRCEKSIEIPRTAIPLETVCSLAAEQAGDDPPTLGTENRTATRDSGFLPSPLEPSGGATAELTASGLQFAAVENPSRRSLVSALVLLGMVTVALALALYVQSKIGFAPPEMFSTLQKPRASNLNVALGSPVAMGSVSLIPRRAVLDQGVLSLDFSMANDGKDPVYLAYLWSDLVLVDELGHHVRVEHLASGATPQPPEEIAPGSRRDLAASFGPISPSAKIFSISGSPGIWTRSKGGQYREISQNGFRIEIKRQDLDAPRSTPGPRV